jgi:Zn-dependent protease with chaperone function
MRVNAAVLPNRRHSVILVGDRLLDEPAALAYVLAHEVNHVRRPWLLVYGALQVVTLAGWLGMGLILPWHALVVVAPVVWVATMLLNWVNELAADYAARTTGPDAARAFWTMLRAARPTRTGLSRLTGTVMAVLAPTHPPITLRAALADRIAHRTLP